MLHWQLDGATLHEILTPITGSHQIIISGSGVDEREVFFYNASLIYDDDVNEKEKNQRENRAHASRVSKIFS